MVAWSTPPGGGWTLWDLEPPPFKRYIPGRVVEVWRPEWGNETSYFEVHDALVKATMTGLWWRRA
jgi:hypothetical protein